MKKGKPGGASLFCWFDIILDSERKGILHPKALHVDAQGSLDFPQITLLFRRSKGRGYAAAGSAAGTANTVHEILRDLGHVIVDDVRHVVYIDSAGGNIGGHQDAMPTLSKTA